MLYSAPLLISPRFIKTIIDGLHSQFLLVWDLIQPLISRLTYLNAVHASFHSTSIRHPSDNWGGLSDLEPCSGNLHERIHTVLSTANFEHLQKVALRARISQDKTAEPAISCTIDPSSFTHGFNNVVLEVSLSDQVYWIAQIQHHMIDASDIAGNAKDLLSEIATMMTVKEQTSIPAPQNFGFDLSPINEVGHPYILMEHLDGQVLGGTIASQVPLKHIPKVAKQLAEVLFQLQGLAFDRLGRLWCGENCDEPPEIIPINPDHASPQTSLEWFYTQRQEENRRALEGRGQDPEWKTACWVLKTAIPHIIIEDRLRGPFPLCHLDLHHGNLLFDDDYNLKGVIDWSQAQTVLLERLAVCPEFITLPAGSDELHKTITILRSLTHEHLHNLEKAQGPGDSSSLTPLCHIFESERADIVSRCTYSLPQRTLWYGRLVARLMYGHKITWEQLVSVYGNAEMY